jgi:polysaccharide export outer membrane protein
MKTIEVELCLVRQHFFITGLIVLSVFAETSLPSQSESKASQQPSTPEEDPHLTPRRGAVDRSDRLRYEYTLGPGDIVTVEVANDDMFKGKPLRINSSGTINLPLVGRVEAAGKTVAELEDQLIADLSKFEVSPEVSVSITEYRSQPVSVLGAVNKPGVYELEGPRTLAQMIAMAGGLQPDAGYKLKLTRETRWGDIPLKGATTDADQKYNTATVKLLGIADGAQPEDNIPVKPFDVIFVPKGEMVYVMGEVTKSGGFVLHDQESMSALEAVSLAGGYSPRAAPKKARILRSIEGEDHREELSLNLSAVASGQAPDVRLLPKDVLVIPNDTAREVRIRVIEAAIGLGTGILIFRR